MPRTRKVSGRVKSHRGQGLENRRPNTSGQRGYLAQLVEDTPELYEQMLSYIRIGGSYIAAMNAIGVDTRTANAWLTKGKEGEGLYATLWHDVRSAVGLASVQTEGEIRKKQGLEWLKHGPRQMLDDDMWNDDSRTPSHVGNDNSTHINITTLPTLEALRELQAVGIDLNALVNHDPNAAVPDDDMVIEGAAHDVPGRAVLPRLTSPDDNIVSGDKGLSVRQGSGSSDNTTSHDKDTSHPMQVRHDKDLSPSPGSSGYGPKESPYPLTHRSTSDPHRSSSGGDPHRFPPDQTDPSSLMARISKNWKKEV